MKILVTGGAGFIGSHVADAYIGAGHEVIIVDNLSSGFKENINKKAKFYQADICDYDKVNEIFEKEKPEIINHHAAQMDVRVSTKQPIYDASINILATINLLENCVKHNVKKIIYANTGGALYGEVSEKDIPVDETYPIMPLSQYGISKHTVEHYLQLYSKNYSLRYTSLRYPNVFGERQNPNGEAGVVAIFTGKMLKNEKPVIFGDGLQTRDYVYVKDIAKANLLALEKGDCQDFNLGSGRRISVLEIFNTLKKELDFKQEPEFKEARLGEIRHIALSAKKAEKELGWKPEFSFEDAIKRVIAYQK